MPRLTLKDFEPDALGEYRCDVHRFQTGAFESKFYGWARSGGDYLSRKGTSRVGWRRDFDTAEAAAEWCVEMINDAVLGNACARLEFAFSILAERLPDTIRAIENARAEAALAEREALAQWYDDRAANYERRARLVASEPAAFGGDSVAQDVSERLAEDGAQGRLDARAIRARTDPATLSAETLTAIVESHGFRMVDTAYLAKLEAAAKEVAK